jgi:hypothetical protein
MVKIARSAELFDDELQQVIRIWLVRHAGRSFAQFPREPLQVAISLSSTDWGCDEGKQEDVPGPTER